MASRAHVVQDYSFGGGAVRPRRQIRYRNDDPVVLPRSSIWSTGGGLVAVVLAAGAIVVGSAYAAYHTEPAALAETPALAVDRDWQPLTANTRAEVTNLLSGPALAVPSVAAPTRVVDAETDTPLMPSDSHEATINDSAPRRMTPPDAPPAIVPNPTTTPADAIAPPNSAPETPTPVLDPENPYR
jgi:hypothetical protein